LQDGDSLILREHISSPLGGHNSKSRICVARSLYLLGEWGSVHGHGTRDISMAEQVCTVFLVVLFSLKTAVFQQYSFTGE